ncbi:MAG: dual specificity protein phosphatase family protein [Planctomycetes bacterium]|nr:dual specificity protein phosphatase family protein [Planctomycetota bacterium]MCC7398233.1 dual specificity protein phosphatase family protein [Planctomycetota bacterium]
MTMPQLAGAPHDQHDAGVREFGEITQVDDGGRLFLSGSIENWQAVHERGISVVIDLEGDVDHGVPTAADQFLYIYLPIHDGDLPNLDRLRAVATLGADLVAKGHRVLSHCGMGLNRSALVAALILMQHGMPAARAVAQLRERRPGALFNDVFANWLLAQS